MTDYYLKLNELLASKTPFVSVIVVDSVGSVPGETGTKMLVTESGWHYGTVGGGKLEKKAIDEALRLLEQQGHSQSTHFVNWSLSKDVGMTCGGMVKLYFERHLAKTWQIVVFGAGHVSNALINLLVHLQCSITCYDPREEWLAKLPDSPKLKKYLENDMPLVVRSIPTDASVLLITMGHTTDSPILMEILRSRTFPYLGVIGSDAKKARLKQDIAQAGLPADLAGTFFCPMGLPIGSNDPAEIAISIAAQLLQVRDQATEIKQEQELSRPLRT